MARQRASRVTQRGAVSSSRMTRQKCRVAAAERPISNKEGRDLIERAAEVEAGHSIRDGGGGEDTVLGDDDEWEVLVADADMDVEMVESQEYFDTRSQPSPRKGKGRLMEIDEEKKEEEEEERVFPFMELPTEIRLEIYRACLTRPYKVLLSKTEKPRPQVKKPPTRRDVVEVSDPEDALDEQVQALLSRSEVRIMRDLVSADNSSRLRRPLVSGVRNWASRRFNRAYSSQTNAALSASTAINSGAGAGASASATSTDFALPPHNHAIPTSSTRFSDRGRVEKPTDQYVPRVTKPQSADPLIINILRASKQVYKEARDVLYSENVFLLDIGTAVPSLAALHQRSRRHIKHVELEIPTYTEILERFSEVVRLSLRYCSGLKKLVIHTPFTLPGADGTTSSNTTVYANGFDILRWLPQQCEVVLEGIRNAEIEVVVKKHLGLAKTQDKVRVSCLNLRRQQF